MRTLCFAVLSLGLGLPAYSGSAFFFLRCELSSESRPQIHTWGVAVPNTRDPDDVEIFSPIQCAEEAEEVSVNEEWVFYTCKKLEGSESQGQGISVQIHRYTGQYIVKETGTLAAMYGVRFGLCEAVRERMF